MSVLQSKAAANGGISFTDQVVRMICSPIANASGAIVNGVQGFFTGAIHSSSLQEENQRLKRQIANLSMYTETVTRLEKEVNSLRGEVGLDKTYQREKVVADIAGYFPSKTA